MCRLLETIRIVDNRAINLEYHSARVNLSRYQLFHAKDTWNLAELITLPQLDRNTIYKCRLVYSESIEKIEFLPYKPRKIHALVMVSADHIEYPLKFEDRTELEALGKAISLPNEDILIVKENKITDTSFANIVFFDGRHWFTPSSPLLKGTKRARYLYEGRISERIISPDDLRFYRKARLINAMIDLEDSEDILIEQIRPADGCDKRTINPNSGDRM